jgi:hypothetical protein
MTKENFYQILWRPRPASLLSADDKKKVVRNLKKYERKFERADKMLSRRKGRAAMAGKVSYNYIVIMHYTQTTSQSQLLVTEDPCGIRTCAYIRTINK